LIVSLVSFFVFQAIEGQIETEITGITLFNSVLSALPLVFAVGMISMFLATFCSSRRFASMVATVILIVSYFGNTLSSSTTE
jgi:hypothetical protein